MAIDFKPTALLLTLLASTASAQQFLDLNSLQAFIPATTADELPLLPLDRFSLNGTSIISVTTPNPAYTFSSSSETVAPPPERDSIIHPTPLAKRQDACGTYNSCANLGAPSLCCPTNAICSQDPLGRVGCCPLDAACTGQIPGAGGVVATATGTSLQAGGYTITTTAVITPTSAEATGGFVLAGTETVAVLGNGGVVLRPPLILRLIARLFR